MASHENPSFHLRVPPDLRKRLKLAAVENDRSMTEEILARLERSFSENDLDRAKAVKMLADVISMLDKGHQG